MRVDFTLSLLALPFLLLSVWAVPTATEVKRGGSVTDSALQRRTTPFFPDQPPSCPICAKDYPSINSCAEAAPVLQNFTSIIFNPGAFIDVIKCACVDTFQSVFPQCVDCFLRTGQENILNTPNLPGVVDGMRKICAIESSLLGNVSAVNGETTPSVPGAPAPSPTSNGDSQVDARIVSVFAVTVGIGLGSLFA